MLKYRRAFHFRHIVHLTRFVVEREKMGKSGYVSRQNNFRHRSEEVKDVNVR